MRWARHVTRTGEAKNICGVVVKQRKGRFGNLNADRRHAQPSVYSRLHVSSSCSGCYSKTDINIILEMCDCVHWIKPAIRFSESGKGISGSIRGGDGRHFQCLVCNWWISKNFFCEAAWHLRNARRAPNGDIVDGSLLFACRVKSGREIAHWNGFSLATRSTQWYVVTTFPWAFVITWSIFFLKPRGYYMYHQVYHSTILRSAQTVYFFFVWISEETAIISLYNINWLVFVTETECVYCAIRASCL